MAWSWGKKGGPGRDKSWSEEQSSSKRRKVEEKSSDMRHDQQLETSKDDWDDDEDFTQNELEQLDLFASQAISQPPAPVPTQTTKPPAVASFAVPIGSARGPGSRSMSSSDSSTLPRSLSSRSTSETSLSLTSSASSNGRHDSSKEKMQIKFDEEKKRAQEMKYQYEGQIKCLRDRLHKQEEELERIRAVENDKMEQLRQTEREKVSKLQSQNEGLSTQVQFKERECQSLQEKNTILQQKIKRIQQQTQAGSGQSIVSLTQSQKSASPHKVPVRPSPPSKQKQQEMKELMGADKSWFPTTYSFMEQPVSTMVVPPPTASSVSCQTTGIDFATKPPLNRRLHLHARASKGTGIQVVRRLLQTSHCEATLGPKVEPEKHKWDPGLVGLLHDMSTSLKIAGLTYSRGNDSSYLSPIRPKRPGMKLSDSASSDGTVQVVTRQNLQLAIEGLTLLLDNAATNKIKSDQKSEIKLTADVAKSTDTNTGAGTVSDQSRIVECVKEQRVGEASKGEPTSAAPKGNRSKSDAPKWANNSFSYNSGAVMLLPLLTDYIQHYVDLIHSTLRSSLLTPDQVSDVSQQSLDSFRSYAECGSCDSSFDSLGSQLGQLLQEGKIYASCVEMYAVTALRCLVLLVQLCPEVGDNIIAKHTSLTLSSSTSPGNSTTSGSSNVGTETDQQSKKSSSSTGADDERSTSSSEIRVICNTSNQSQYSLSSHLNSRVSSNLLHLVMRLAGQDLEDNQSNAAVVTLALNVLTCLCRCCCEANLPKLESIITRGILTNCFRQTKHIPVLIWAQRLLVSLAKSEKLLARLCTKSENCPLYLMHRACSVNTDGVFDLCKEYVTSLSNIISVHRSGLHHLLSNTCLCTEELVVAVIMALYHLFSTYKTARVEQRRETLNTLAQGVTLIHSLAQGDSAFSQHHMAVQLQYVRLLSGVASIMKTDKQPWELQLSTLEELCDFDISDASQDSEGEDKMDQT